MLPLLGVELTAVAGILFGRILLTGYNDGLGKNFPWHLAPIIPFPFFSGALRTERSWLSFPGDSVRWLKNTRASGHAGERGEVESAGMHEEATGGGGACEVG